MAEATKTLADLRKPFPAGTVGKLPKGGVQLDYVGHAAVTDRLLEVDPSWSWEPMATDEDGLPKTDKAGNLWIRLTVLGVTRIGVGDGRNAKECIGDALRNAAMRFGVALDLWSKEELESIHDGANEPNEKPTAQADPVPLVVKTGTAVGDELTRAKKAINEELEEQGYVIPVKKKAFITKVLGHSTIDNVIEANLVMDQLENERGGEGMYDAPGIGGTQE